MSARSLHILHVIENLENRGAERQLVLIARGLRRRGHRVEVCCLRDGGELGYRLRAEGIPVFEFHKKGRFDAALLARLVQFVHQGQFDVLHTHVFTANLWGRLAALLAGTPVIISHEHGAFTLASPLRMLANRVLSQFTDLSFVVSQELVHRFAAENRIPPERLRLLPNGLDFSRLNGQESDLRKVFAGRFPLIGTVGALEPRKDHQTFIYAAKLLLKKYPGAQFLVIGDGELRHALENSIQKLQLEDHVHLLGQRNDVFGILKMLDVFVLSSTTEGTSVALLEAMAAGCPVVATSVGGTPEVLHWGRFGNLVPPKNPMALAQSIDDLLQDKSQAQSMANAAKKHVFEHYDIERTVEHLEETYFSLLHAEKNHRRGV